MIGTTVGRSWARSRGVVRRLGAVLVSASVMLAPTPALAATPAPAAVGAPSAVSSVAGAISLPALPGRYPVGTVTRELVDHSRVDPYAPTLQDRAVMVQVWYPARHADRFPTAPLLTPALAAFLEKENGLPAGLLSTVLTRAHRGVPAARPQDEQSGQEGWPVVLFSPGWGFSRSLYSTMVEDLASRGYVVVAIDHPYDADAVEMADGHLVLGNQPVTEAAAVRAAEVRVDDTRFVLDQLPVLRAGLRLPLDLHRVGMFGQSMGGATAASAMLADRRIMAGANLDGSFFGPVVDRGLDRPFLLLSGAGHDRSTDPTWAAAWPKLRGWHANLMLAGSEHMTFSDIAVLAGPLQLATLLPPGQLEAMVGTIDGLRAAEIQQTYLTAYFDRFLRHRPAPLLNGPDPRYPEVLFQA
ncbi:MAG TPA: hypothetical protein VFP72_05580 [Kineosporiaceae bacterium]|nr:hypothetical protein [Kineosporiaceae bacterium]